MTNAIHTIKEVKVNFNLRDSKTPSKPTPLHCILRYNAQRVVIPNVEKVEPRYWNKTSQTARGLQTNTKGQQVNESLSSIKATVEKIYNDYKRKYRAYPEPADLKELCLKALNSTEVIEVKPISDLIAFASQFIEDTEQGKRINPANGKPYSPAIITVYKTVKSVLEEFKDAKRYNLSFANITLDFYHEFSDYLKFNKNFSTNTIGKYIKTVKTFLNEARERQLTTVEYYKSKRFKVLTEDTESIYLSSAELASLYELDLSKKPHLDRVRDLFLVGCWSGLRFSDYKDISPKNIQGDFLKVKTVKTGKEVVIPIHDTIKSIMSKYEGKTENSLPPAISNQKMNEYLKEVAKEAKINEAIQLTQTKGGKAVVKSCPKHTLITSHTARRSFATNMYLMGVATLTIMAITGHKTEKSFMRYIKVTPEEHANNMLSIWRRGNLKAV